MAKQPEENKTADLVPTVYAYLRVSTNRQDVDNQRHGVLEYANGAGLAGLVFVEDSITSSVPWQKRRVGALLLQQCKAGDVVVFSEISRMARSTLEVLEVLKHCLDNGITAHIAKQRLVLDDSLQAKIMATMLGLAAEIEREFIRMRTTEALAARQQQIADDGSFVSKAGRTITKLGRPPGKAENVKLDQHRAQVQELIDKAVNKRDIARIVGCSPSTLYDWLARRQIKPRAEAND